ncbi:MAG: EMC3/TMCO1 family protein [Candidatus Pacearchaeota archaeon]
MKKEIWILFLVMIISFYIAYNWNEIPLIKNNVEAILNPTLGKLLDWNIYIGFIFIVGLTSLTLTLAQKYLSDQKQLRELKKEQQILNEEMKKYKNHPEKLLEIQKKQLEFIPKTFNLTLMPMIYSSIPIVLLFRWFGDILNPVFGKWWVLYYIIGAMIFSAIFRKVFDVV